MRPRYSSLLLALLALLLGAGCQAFRERAAKESSFEMAKLSADERAKADAAIRMGLERVVTIRPSFMTIGSGCVVTSDGWVLTAEHVVRGRRVVDVEFPDGSIRDGRVIATSGGNDFALLKVEGKNLRYFRLGTRPALGDPVVAVGTPTKWVAPNASAGRVIYPRVRIPGEQGLYYFDAVFHSAPIFPGDSGGPLMNLAGDLVGLHGGFASENASVAPAAAEVMRVLPGGGKKRLAMEMFAVPEGGGPIVWPARVPRDFAESSEWTIRSVEDTLVEVFSPSDRDTVRKILEATRASFVERADRDPRRDDELVRAMLAEVFAKLTELEERARDKTAAAPPPGQPSAARRQRRRRLVARPAARAA